MKQLRSATPRTSVAQHWALLYVPLQTRVWRWLRAGIAEAMVAARTREVSVEKSILIEVLGWWCLFVLVECKAGGLETRQLRK